MANFTEGQQSQMVSGHDMTHRSDYSASILASSAGPGGGSRLNIVIVS